MRLDGAKGEMPGRSWKLFGTWRKIEVPSRAPPLTQRLVRSMAAFEMEHGRLEMIVSLLLGFSCLLRTGELLQLKVSDFLHQRYFGHMLLKGDCD